MVLGSPVVPLATEQRSPGPGSTCSLVLALSASEQLSRSNSATAGKVGCILMFGYLPPLRGHSESFQERGQVALLLGGEDLLGSDITVGILFFLSWLGERRKPREQVITVQLDDLLQRGHGVVVEVGRRLRYPTQGWYV